MNLTTIFKSIATQGVMLYLCCNSISVLSQTNDLRFRSEMLVAKEAFTQNNLASAQTHLDKAANFANDTAKLDEIDRLYIQILMQQDKLIEAESVLQRLTKRNPDLVRIDRDFAELTFVITDGASAQRRKLAQIGEEKRAWDATDKNNLDKIKAYLALYPDGYLKEIVQLQLASCFITQKKPFRPEDTPYLHWWEHENIENNFRDSVYAISVHNIKDLTGYPHLLGIALHSDTILSSRTSMNPLMRRDLRYLYFKSCGFEDQKMVGPLASAQLSLLAIKDCNLKKISPLSQPNLIALDVSRNQLTKLPKFTGSEPLEEINASYNKILDFPDDVLDIKTLKELVLGHNLFEAVPDKIIKLQNLRFLDISNNAQIKNLPPNLFSLKNLETLFLHGLGVSRLPLGIQNLTKLKTLALGGELKEMPSGIEELSNLEEIYLIGVNRLKEFPEVISKFKKLKVLYIDGNPWNNVPDQLSSLRRIKKLYLVNFKLTEIPDVAYKLPNIEVLDLSGNSIAQISERIVELKHLKEINLSGAKLDKADLLRLRIALPGTKITYLHPIYNTVIASEALTENEKGINLSNAFQYFKEGDLSSIYELGKFFENREDNGMAYLFYSQAKLNTKLIGRGRVLINQLAMAEVGKAMEPSFSLGPLQKSPDTWDKTITKFLDRPSIREFEAICNCSPRDEQAEQIKKKGCAEAYREYKAAVVALDRFKEFLLNEAEQLIPGARQKLASAENWVMMGKIFDMAAVSSNLAGWGSVVGSTLALLKRNAADTKAAQAALIKNQLEEIQKRIDQIKDKIESLGYPRA